MLMIFSMMKIASQLTDGMMTEAHGIISRTERNIMEKPKTEMAKCNFVNGKYANGYVNNSFYKDGKVVTGWHDDGSAWYSLKMEINLPESKDGNGECNLLMVNTLMLI